MNKKIVYGTARLSDNNYGRSNNINLNQKDINSLNKFIDNNKNIKSYEIATGYKNSIKNSLKIMKKEIHLKITKIVNNKQKTESYINNIINEYLLKTGRKKIDILYLHQSSLKDISNLTVLKVLKNLKKKRKIKHIGVSLYNLKELRYALRSKIINVIQIPINIADTFLYSKIPDKSKKIIVARSVYLQGTLVNKVKKHPYKEEINFFKKKLKTMCKNNRLEYFRIVTSFAFNLKNVDFVIFGSIKKNNLNKSLNSIFKIKKENMEIFYNNSKKFKKWSNPRNWFDQKHVV
tara:strand:+ start:1056 stop:1928 length:873 start_codon:yes stop_codon:yes gene_type:complete